MYQVIALDTYHIFYIIFLTIAIMRKDSCLHLVVISICAIFFACENTSMSLNTVEVKFDSIPDPEIKGIRLNLEVMGADDILIYDSLFMVMNSNPDGHLKVFNLRDYSKIADLCLGGRANNEFIQPFTTANQLYLKDNNLLMPIVDNGTVLKTLNVSESIRQKKTIIDSKENCPFISLGEVIILEGGGELIYWHLTYDDAMDPETYHQPRYVIKKDGKEKESINVFPKYLDTNDKELASALYNCATLKHPHKNIIAQSYYRIGYLMLLNIDSGQGMAIHVTGTPSFNDKFSGTEIPGRYFGGLVGTDDYFIVRYMGGRSITEKPDSYIKIFDWEGKYLGGARLDIDCETHDIAFDDKTNTLYGLDRMQEIFCAFDLNPLIESIKK